MSFGWDQVAWTLLGTLLGRLLGGCLDIAKQPNGKSVGNHSEIMGCDTKSRRRTLLSNVFFFRRCFGNGKRRKSPPRRARRTLRTARPGNAKSKRLHREEPAFAKASAGRREEREGRQRTILITAKRLRHTDTENSENGGTRERQRRTSSPRSSRRTRRTAGPVNDDGKRRFLTRTRAS